MKLYPLICVASLFAFNAALAGEYQFNTPVKQTVYEGTLGNKKIRENHEDSTIAPDISIWYAYASAKGNAGFTQTGSCRGGGAEFDDHSTV